MKIKSLSIFSIAALVALLSAFVAVPAAVSAQGEDDSDTDTGIDIANVTDIQVTGTTDDGGTFEGTFSVNEFVSGRDGELMAAGTLTGEVTYDQSTDESDESTAAENGRMAQQINEEVTIPVSSEGFGDEGTCGDLSVTLGPVDIDLSTPDGEMPDDGTPPGDDTPDDGTPEDDTPDDGATDDGTPDDGATDDGTTDDGTSDDGTTDDGTSDDDATDEGTRNGLAPGETNPDEITPEDDASDDDVTDDQQTGDVLHIDAVSFDVSTDDAIGGAVSDLLCNLSGLFGDELDAGSLANLLNLFIKLS